MPFLATAAAIAAIAGTAVSVVGAIKQGQAAKQEEEARANLEKIRAKRERVQQIRQARIQRAEILQQGANAGVGESSSVATGAAGVYGQAFSNISYINQQTSIGQSITNARQSQLDAQGVSVLGQGFADIGGTIFANRKNIQDVFADDIKPKDVSGGVYDIEEPII